MNDRTQQVMESPPQRWKVRVIPLCSLSNIFVLVALLVASKCIHIHRLIWQHHYFKKKSSFFNRSWVEYVQYAHTTRRALSSLTLLAQWKQTRENGTNRICWPSRLIHLYKRMIMEGYRDGYIDKKISLDFSQNMFLMNSSYTLRTNYECILFTVCIAQWRENVMPSFYCICKKCELVPHYLSHAISHMNIANIFWHFSFYQLLFVCKATTKKEVLYTSTATYCIQALC